MFGIKAIVDELKKVKWAVESLERKLNSLQGEIRALREESNDIILPEQKDPDIEAINAIYRTKQGLFSFKKAKRAMRED